MLTIEQAAASQSDYEPGAVSKFKTRRVSMTAFVGPTAAGKSFQMRSLERSTHTVGTTVTRAPRPGDIANYSYVTTEAMLQLIERGEPVQYGVTPAGDIYASLATDYDDTKPNVMDVVSGQIEHLQRKCGFGTLRVVSVFAPVPEWSRRLHERFEGMDNDKIEGRLDEAATSLAWSLQDDHDVPHLAVVSDPVRSDQTRSHVFGFVVGAEGMHDPGVSTYARNTGEQMLEAVPQLRRIFLRPRAD